mmetsp:Transcript_23214/g.22750  ORF Transcript_23214/g.22750 Transcript_23214/m.22750 type:complete len:152 (+) Transcript_23214:404-859(+)
MYEENKELKKMNESLKIYEQERKKDLEKSKGDFEQELENLRRKLRTEEELKSSLRSEKSKVEQNMKKTQEFVENLELEIQTLEKTNENLHRKINFTNNSVLFQSQINHQYMASGDDGMRESPPKKDMSTSFHISGFIDNKDKLSNPFGSQG